MRASAELEPDPIIHRISERLFGPEITLGGLDGSMPKQDLDLFQVATRAAAELCASTAQIMGGELAELGLLGIAHHQIPDGLFVSDLVSDDDSTFVDRPEEPAFGNAGSLGPEIDPRFDPGRYGHQAQPLAFAEQIGDHPAGFSLLEVFDVESQQLRSSQAASEK